jgi:DNA-binding beta-propeller fold protein YncE
MACRSGSILTNTAARFRPTLTGLVAVVAAFAASSAGGWDRRETGLATQRFLYVAVPGIRNDLRFGGHGLVVFDIDQGHRFVKRIKTAGLDENGKPRNVKGVCASAATNLLHISTPRTLSAIDLVTETVLWERAYDGGCDRMALAPDGKTIFLPSFESDHWHVVDAVSGDVLGRIVTRSGAHNTVFARDGRHVFLAGLKSPVLRVADAKSHEVVGHIGPFGGAIRPFTVNGAGTLCFVTVNGLLGFETGEVKTGRVLHRVEVQGVKTGPVKRHGCPSHGIGLTPDEKEIWVADAANSCMHIFDATVMPPKQVASVRLREQPGWITFSLDGKYAYPSTGDVVETATRRIVAGLSDETGAEVHSEKMVEVHIQSRDVVRAGDQFGVGRVR